MDFTIARLGPATEHLKRIADALTIIADLYSQDCAARNILPSPSRPGKDVIQEEDITYVDDAALAREDLKRQLGILTEEQREELLDYAPRLAEFVAPTEGE
jgi:hypothetical protein